MSNRQNIDMQCPLCRHRCGNVPNVSVPNVNVPNVNVTNQPTWSGQRLIDITNSHVGTVHYPDADEAGWNPNYRRCDRLPTRSRWAVTSTNHRMIRMR